MIELNREHLWARPRRYIQSPAKGIFLGCVICGCSRGVFAQPRKCLYAGLGTLYNPSPLFPRPVRECWESFRVLLGLLLSSQKFLIENLTAATPRRRTGGRFSSGENDWTWE